MNQALRPKTQDSQEEQQQEVVYVEVKEKAQIKKILQTEKSKLSQSVKCQNQKQQPRKVIEPQTFVKDDRQIIKIDNKKDQNNKKQNNQKKQIHPTDQKKAPESRVVGKMQKQTGNIKTTVKKQTLVERDEKKEKKITQRPADMKRTEKKDYNILYQQKNGQRIKLQIEKSDLLFENQILINEQQPIFYAKLANTILHQYPFITLKAYGQQVSKAILVAGLVAEQNTYLEQITIPTTIFAKEITKNEVNKTTRAAIIIEMSMKKLDSRHIGHQVITHTNSQQTTTQKAKDKNLYKQRTNERELR